MGNSVQADFLLPITLYIMEKSDVECVRDFIETIWNNGRLDLLNQYLHPAFRDYAQPFFAVQNADGLKMYLRQLGKDFIHKTAILEVSALEDVVMLKVKLELQVQHRQDAHQECKKLFLIEGVRRFTMRDHLIYDHREQMEILSEVALSEHTTY